MCDHKHSGDCSHEAEAIGTAQEGTRYDLRNYIDFDKLNVLNEVTDGSGKSVFKTMEGKNDRSTFVESDCDEELLFNIPFTGHVRINGIVISGDENESHPARVRLFKDREALSFDDCRVEADQEIDLKMDANDPCTRLMTQLGSPIVQESNAVITITDEKIVGVAADFYDFIGYSLEQLGHGSGIPISLVDLTWLMKYLLRMRLYVVMSRAPVPAPAAADYIAYSPICMPRPLATVINNIGMCTVCEGAVNLIPCAQQGPIEQDPSFDSSLFRVLSSFEELSYLLLRVHGMPLIPVSPDPRGNTYWALVVERGDYLIPTRECHTLRVRMSFREVLPMDQLLACVTLLGPDIDFVNNSRNPYEPIIEDFHQPTLVPWTTDIRITIPDERINGFSNDLYASLCDIIDYKAINQRDFCWFITHILRSRLQIISVAMASEKPITENRFPRIRLIRPLARVINNIGVCKVCDGAVRLIPVAQHAPHQTEEGYTPVAYKIRHRFNQFIDLITHRHDIPTESISMAAQGTPFWALLVEGEDSPKPIHTGPAAAQKIRVVSSFKEWTRYDQLLACVSLIYPDSDPVNEHRPSGLRRISATTSRASTTSACGESFSTNSARGLPLRLTKLGLRCKITRARFPTPFSVRFSEEKFNFLIVPSGFQPTINQ
ncbi:unnamed protein product [Caenorhabditis auriculariae]|uniref:PITH domain-containing protein n=1 Tax=Caenorhabditis auriculariae TaxID=2777116 RepID=A0A8S1GTR9_9PELO|nr:unnamed protein product [Caenorhabditis auriculariae]